MQESMWVYMSIFRRRSRVRRPQKDCARLMIEFAASCAQTSTALLFFNPLLTREFEFVFAAQLAEFNRLYDRPPTHIDGHQHFHLASNMLIQNILPQGARVRRSFSFERGEKGLVNRCYRRIVDWWLNRRHRTTDHFFSLSDHLAPAKFEKVLSLAGGSTVELMAHPERQNEYQFLMSDGYLEAVSDVWRNEPLGS